MQDKTGTWFLLREITELKEVNRDLLDAVRLLLPDIDRMIQKTTGLEQLAWMRHAKAHRAVIDKATGGKS
jgi:hypothetical protein